MTRVVGSSSPWYLRRPSSTHRPCASSLAITLRTRFSMEEEALRVPFFGFGSNSSGANFDTFSYSRSMESNALPTMNA